MAYMRAYLAELLGTMGETASARAEAEHAMRAVVNQPAGSRFRVQVEQIAAQILNRT
jgi:hypothetical protein